jgi:hypothetical protein
MRADTNRAAALDFGKLAGHYDGTANSGHLENLDSERA